MSTQEEGFLDRWSKRKLSEPELEEDTKSLETGEEPERFEGLSDAEILEKLELPDPETLKEGDDFTGFMNATVPDRLRQRALRVLWRSNPALANLDGLVDYGDDFTDAAMVPEVLNTAYKVGRGFLKDLIEEEEPVENEANDEAIEDAEETPVAAEVSEPEDTPVEAAPFDLPQPEPERHVARPRMKFTTG